MNHNYWIFRRDIVEWSLVKAKSWRKVLRWKSPVTLILLVSNFQWNMQYCLKKMSWMSNVMGPFILLWSKAANLRLYHNYLWAYSFWSFHLRLALPVERAAMKITGKRIKLHTELTQTPNSLHNLWYEPNRKWLGETDW